MAQDIQNVFQKLQEQRAKYDFVINDGEFPPCYHHTGFASTHLTYKIVRLYVVALLVHSR